MNGGNFHTFAFSQTTGAALAAFTAINGVPDGQFTLQTATTFLAPKQGKIMAAGSFGATLTRTRLNVPSFRNVSLPILAPINVSATVPSPVNIYKGANTGLELPIVEPIGVDAVDTAIDTISVVLFSMYNFRPVPAGKVFRLRLTGTAVGVINTWQNSALTLADPLQTGRYAVVGLDVQSANAIAARLLFADGGFRPGCLCRNALGNVPHPIFTNGELGVYGEFSNANTPSLDILLGGGGAAAAIEVYMDVIRIGDN